MNIEDLIVIDCEASGLSDKSYPIEVGVAFGNDSIDFLIKPIESWDYWSEKAESIHNIKRSELIEKGISLYDAAYKLNSQLRGLTIYSDAADYENFWINKIFEEVGLEKNFNIDSIFMLNFDSNKYKNHKDKLYKSMTRHRALNDAIIIRESIIKALY